MEELIRKVLKILDGVEVHGRDNIINMYAALKTLENIADALRHNKQTVGKGDECDNDMQRETNIPD